MGADDTQPGRPSSPYDSSKEPKTMRIDPPGYKPSASPRQGQPSGWPEQPPQYGGSGSGGQYGGGSGQGGAPAGYGSAPGGYGSAPAGYGSAPGGQGGQYDSTQQFDSTKQYGGSQYEPGYTPGQGYGSPSYPGQPGGAAAAPPVSGRRPRRRRRHRGITIAFFAVIVLLVLLIIGDPVGKAIAENQFASQVTAQDAMIHPSINIKESLPGDPFLLQAFKRDLTEVDITASNIAVPAGPATITITSVIAHAHGLHINSSLSGGTVDNIDATVFISYASLSSTLSSQTAGIANLTLSPGPDGAIKADFGIAGTNLLSETAKITIKGSTVSIAWGSSSGDGNNPLGGIIGAVTGGGSGGNGTLPNLTFTIPKLPAGVQIGNPVAGPQGITVTGSGKNLSLSQ